MLVDMHMSRRICIDFFDSGFCCREKESRSEVRLNHSKKEMFEALESIKGEDRK